MQHAHRACIRRGSVALWQLRVDVVDQRTRGTQTFDRRVRRRSAEVRRARSQVVKGSVHRLQRAGVERRQLGKDCTKRVPCCFRLLRRAGTHPHDAIGQPGKDTPKARVGFQAEGAVRRGTQHRRHRTPAFASREVRERHLHVRLHGLCLGKHAVVQPLQEPLARFLGDMPGLVDMAGGERLDPLGRDAETCERSARALRVRSHH